MKKEKEISLAALLRNAGSKATPGRLAILKILKDSKKPLSIPEISRGPKKEKMDQATLYRALAALEKAGAVRRVELRHGHADYEFAADDHHHLVCTHCGRIEDFGDCDLNKLARKALRASSFFATIDRHSLEFFGLCTSCARRRKA